MTRSDQVRCQDVYWRRKCNRKGSIKVLPACISTSCHTVSKEPISTLVYIELCIKNQSFLAPLWMPLFTLEFMSFWILFLMTVIQRSWKVASSNKILIYWSVEKNKDIRKIMNTGYDFMAFPDNCIQSSTLLSLHNGNSFTLW